MITPSREDILYMKARGALMLPTGVMPSRPLNDDLLLLCDNSYDAIIFDSKNKAMIKDPTEVSRLIKLHDINLEIFMYNVLTMTPIYFRD